MAWEDPIVAEVRRAREDLFRETGYDIRRLFELLREIDRRRHAGADADPASKTPPGAAPPGRPRTP